MSGVRPEWVAGNNFLMIHLDLVDALDGSYEAAALLNRIQFRAGDGWWVASKSEMQEDTRLSERKLDRAIRELREAGMVESERVNTWTSTLRWRLVWSVPAEQDVLRFSGTDEPSFPEGTQDVSSFSERDVSSFSPSSKKGKNPPTPQRGAVRSLAGPDEEEFALWWSNYPRKVGKRDAAKAYRAALKRAPAGEILTGLYSQLPDLKSRKPNLVPHPTTWLNGDRWADELDHGPSEYRSETDTMYEIELQQRANGAQ